MSSPHEFTVEGVGAFAFRKRSLADQVLIQANASRMMGGPVDDPELRAFVHAVQTLVVLQTQAPAGWNPLAVDPLDAKGTEKLWLVHDALRDAEERFRQGAVAQGA